MVMRERERKKTNVPVFRAGAAAWPRVEEHPPPNNRSCPLLGSNLLNRWGRGTRRSKTTGGGQGCKKKKKKAEEWILSKTTPWWLKSMYPIQKEFARAAGRADLPKGDHHEG